MNQTEEQLRLIPHVDKLLKNKIIIGSGVYRREAADAVRDILAELREKLKKGEIDAVPTDDDLASRALELATTRANKRIRKVINATGVILHSNLGRACLSEAAVQAAAQAAGAYSTLEYDAENGTRGSRTKYCEENLRLITGCESSLIVNNNAAAILLVLAAIASGGNVIVSRGELVEIGGGFRIPEIMRQFNCELREIGTTNKTRLSDYADAIDEQTRVLFKIHTSNFKVVGFTESVALKNLVELGNLKGIPVVEDIGSGALTDIRRYGIFDEPIAVESLKSGADIVTFSGDKLLGGPQCGIVLGGDKYISIMRKHPLYRALRLDKMTIAALEATLRVYSDPLVAGREIPVLLMLSLNEETLQNRASRLCAEVIRLGGNVEVVRSKSVAGSGSAPWLTMDSYAISPAGNKKAAEYELKLREKPIPIIGHIEENRLLLDVRTMFEEDFGYIAETVASVTNARGLSTT